MYESYGDAYLSARLLALARMSARRLEPREATVASSPNTAVHCLSTHVVAIELRTAESAEFMSSELYFIPSSRHSQLRHQLDVMRERRKLEPGKCTTPA